MLRLNNFNLVKGFEDIISYNFVLNELPLINNLD